MGGSQFEDVHGASVFSFDTLSAIHYIGWDRFYDMEVPAFANYFANGFVSHNCGLGKCIMSLVWAENVVRKTNGNVLFLTPLAVGAQTVREGEKFGVACRQVRTGEVHRGINVVNYQRLHYYDPKDFVGVVADESGILKNFDGKTRRDVTEFLRGMRYRLLCTATPAPNDFMELGSSSEALGVMGRNQMLGMFFANDGEQTQKWRLKGHAKGRFWQWVATWARAIRRPSDFGFEDGAFLLPPLKTTVHVVPSPAGEGFFAKMAVSLDDQGREKRRSIEARCEEAVKHVPRKRPCILWCQLIDEGRMLTRSVPGAVEVQGSDPDEVKEERMLAFSSGQIRVLVSKPTIAGFGMNWQHCSDVIYFPTHSHEQYYQAIRRCWRFGQERKVRCHLVYSEAESPIVHNMLRKERQSEEMYAGIVRHMKDAMATREGTNGHVGTEVPSWLRG